MNTQSAGQTLYASATLPNTWIAVAGLTFGIIVFLVAVPITAMWIVIIAIALLATAILAVGTGRRKVTGLTRYGDELSVQLAGNRSFRAPVSSFSNWRYIELGRASAINFHWRGQRYALPAQTATLIDPEGFGELDASLGQALAGRWNADTLRKRR